MNLYRAAMVPMEGISMTTMAMVYSSLDSLNLYLAIT